VPVIATILETETGSEAPPRPRILFVDDEPLLTKLGEEFLRRLGCDSVVATCPEDALAKFKASAFDAVITDLTMPKMSGLDLQRAIQELRPDVPVVLTTAFQQKLKGRNPLDLGFRSFLLKPYNLKTLGATLREVLAPAAPV